MFATIIDWLNTALYSYVLIILLILGGIYFTVCWGSSSRP